MDLAEENKPKKELTARIKNVECAFLETHEATQIAKNCRNGCSKSGLKITSKKVLTGYFK